MPAPDTVRRFLRHYFYGLFARCWNSSWSAADAALGLAVGAVVSTAVSAPTWQAVLSVFLTTWARTAITYFAKNPLPEKLDANTRPPMGPGIVS